jgi:hypothetical protein
MKFKSGIFKAVNFDMIKVELIKAIPVTGSGGL